MAETSGVGAIFDPSQYNYTEQIKTANQELGKDEFLKILITQLQNQDPTQPMEDTAMIAQMAQFSALEAMTNLSTTFSLSQAYDMIGQGVIGTIRNEETGVVSTIGGTVDSAGMLNGKPYVMIGKDTLFVSDIMQVFDNSLISGNAEGILAGTNMVGKYVQAIALDGEETITVEGRVDQLLVKNGSFFVKVGDHELSLSQITAVSNEPFPVPPVEETPEEGGTPDSGQGIETEGTQAV